MPFLTDSSFNTPLSQLFGQEEIYEPKAFNLTNANERDKHVHFYPEKHIYTFDDEPMISVSSLITQLFPGFDSRKAAARKATSSCPMDKILEEWESQGAEARDAGTFMHLQIEQSLLGLPVEHEFTFNYSGRYVNSSKKIDISHELHLFEEFREERKPESFRTEWRICDEVNGVAGTIDYLTKDKEGNYRMCDWKRSNKIGFESVGGFCVERNNRFGRRAFPPLDHLDDTVFNHYCLQQNLYRYILREHYGIELCEMYLVVLYPTNVNYNCVEIPVMEEETRFLLNYARENKSQILGLGAY